MEPTRAERWSHWAFGAAFIVVAVFFVQVVAPFLTAILIAGFLVVLFAPAHERLVRAFGGRRAPAAALSSAAVLLLLLLPAALVVTLLVLQAVDLLDRLRLMLGPGGLSELLRGEVPEALRPLVDRLDEISARLELLGVDGQVQGAVATLAGALSAFLASLFGRTLSLFLNSLLLVVSLYYFFRDGPLMLREFSRASPLEPRYEQAFFRQFKDVAYAMIYVNLVLALIQAVLGVAGFALVGIPRPLAWGALFGLMSLLPILGPYLIWAPVAVWLFATGRYGAGAFLVLYGLFVVSNVDNFLRPLLAKGRINLHPLLVFVTIFGGIVAFGALGVLLGPLVGSLFTAMVAIWKRDFVPPESQPPPPESSDGETRTPAPREGEPASHRT
jgi:predicted PurR-regulated permease PerM